MLEPIALSHLFPTANC